MSEVLPTQLMSSPLAGRSSSIQSTANKAHQAEDAIGKSLDATDSIVSKTV